MKPRNITFALLFVVSIIVMASVVPGVISRANAQTESYKSAVPVVDDIGMKKPRAARSRNISTLKEQPEIFVYLLSQEFLAALLSFLIIFQVTYIYFSYMRKSKKKVKPHKRKPINIKLNKPKIPQAEEPNEKDKDNQDDTKDDSEESSVTHKPDQKEVTIKNQKKSNAELLEEAKELKVERTRHAHRIHHLLEKI